MLLLVRLLMIERVLQCSTHVRSRIVTILLRRRMLRRRGEIAAGAMPCAGVCCCSVAVAVGAVGMLRRLVIRRLHSHMRIGSARRNHVDCNTRPCKLKTGCEQIGSKKSRATSAIRCVQEQLLQDRTCGES